MKNEISLRFSLFCLRFLSYNLQFIGMTLLMVKWYLSIFNSLLLSPVAPVVPSFFLCHFTDFFLPPDEDFIYKLRFISVIHFFFGVKQIENECF